MQFTFPTETQELATLRVDACALILFEGEQGDSPVLRALNQALSGILPGLLEDEQFTGKKNQSFSLHTHGKVGTNRVLLVGAGKRKDFQLNDVRLLTARAVRMANPSRTRSIGIVLPGLEPQQAELVAQYVSEGAVLASYQFDKYWTGERKKPAVLGDVVVLPAVPGAIPADAGTSPWADAEAKAALQRGVVRGQAVAAGTMLARDLVNEGANEMTPRHLASVAEGLAKERGLEIAVFGPNECRDMGMRLYLAVAQGSSEEPRFVHLTYRPSGTPRRKVVLIGKSVTFDSGGLSIKTSDGMLDMKMDMGGGGAVLGAMSALSQLGCPDEVHVICAATENMPGGTAYKLGDVLRSMNGKTVEINNTDAEGRLTLADALCYAVQRIKPDVMIDFATLTGACEVALGPHCAGVMTNNQEAAGQLLDAARAAGEEMWPLPLPDRLTEALKSDIADIKQCGDRKGGCLTAGLFLKEFVGDTAWVHVDMAGPVKAGSEWAHQSKGATGFGVASIIEFLLPRS